MIFLRNLLIRSLSSSLYLSSNIFNPPFWKLEDLSRVLCSLILKILGACLFVLGAVPIGCLLTAQRLAYKFLFKSTFVLQNWHFVVVCLILAPQFGHLVVISKACFNLFK